mgnify:CR=1 FL=1|jgi:hypothetical protein
MNSILAICNESTNEYKKLEIFIKKLQLEENAKEYSDYREILYTGIINRCYSLWETFNKSIVFAYYTLIKEKLLSDNTLISKLKLHELPGYITEMGQYDSDKNFIYYTLKEEYITYTSKNMDINQLNVIYDRVEIRIIDELDGNKNIKEFLTQNSIYFTTNLLADALKEIIFERNASAHYAVIETFKNLNFLLKWTELYKLLLEEISIIICNKILHYKKLLNDSIGEVKNYLEEKKVLCIDLIDNVSITKESILAVVKNNKLIDIVKPISFQVEGIKKEIATNNDKVGIGLGPYFDRVIKINNPSNINILLI